MEYPLRHYFFDAPTKTIFHMADWPPLVTRLAYIGSSDNPTVKMAAAVFGKGKTGCKIREYAG